jgi:hypothetical protein
VVVSWSAAGIAATLRPSGVFLVSLSCERGAAPRHLEFAPSSSKWKSSVSTGERPRVGRHFEHVVREILRLPADEQLGAALQTANQLAPTTPMEREDAGVRGFAAELVRREALTVIEGLERALPIDATGIRKRSVMYEANSLRAGPGASRLF